MREKYESLSLATLKELAKARGLKGVSALRKPELIQRMLEEDEKENSLQNEKESKEKEEIKAETKTESKVEVKAESRPESKTENRGENRHEARSESRHETKSESRNESRHETRSESKPEVRTESRSEGKGEATQLDSGEKANGILEVLPDGYGFIRCENYLPGDNDIYVSPSQIRRFNLKTGDIIQGNIRIKTQGEKFSALLYVTSINGFHPSEGPKRYNFEDMTPIFPNQRLILERPGGTVAMRIVDLISPIGKGQRGMIVSPPKAGKTTLLKDVAKSILRNNKDMHLIILLIDERPEEVTDIREAIHGPNVEVIYSTFDELPEHHKRVSEMVIERARRLVEHKKDVTILLDSITRLARAYNLIIPPSGRTLSGGLDPAALHMPKRFFGAARNMREGGSLTILATALVDTGSKMDDVIYEEFKGTGNMELILDRKLQEKRVFPAIDIQKSGTRREDLLLSREEQEAVYTMRKGLNGMKSEDAVEQILNMFARTKTNAEFVQTIKKQKIL
nr:transcription termination factor Rho [uncultured Blautia sp.]